MGYFKFNFLKQIFLSRLLKSAFDDKETTITNIKTPPLADWVDKTRPDSNVKDT